MIIAQQLRFFNRQARFPLIRMTGRSERKARRAICQAGFLMERMMGVEPTLSAWEAGVLPMNYIRISHIALLLYHIIR